MSSRWTRRAELVGLGAFVAVLVVGLAQIGIASARPMAPGRAGMRPDISRTWTQQFPSTSPAARHDAGMAYDALTQSVILYGGAGLQSGLTLTWIWDGTNWTSHNTLAWPTILGAPSMAYDPATGQTLYFGGNSQPCNPICTPFNEMYNWTGRNWTQLSPATIPPARSGARVVYDAATRTVVLFGGSGFGGSDDELLNDTWTWDGTTWTQQFPATSPSGRYYYHLAYDPAHRKVVLFGGVVAGGPTGETTANDTWTWDGTNWTQQFPTVSPAARTDGAMAFDPATQTTILFGGDLREDSDQTLNDTWSWDGTNWTQIFPASSPSPRWRTSMVYDTATGSLVLFAGSTGSPGGGTLLSETWTFQ